MARVRENVHGGRTSCTNHPEGVALKPERVAAAADTIEGAAEPSPFHMMEPPASDRDLDATTVRRVLAAQFSRLALRSIDYLGSGWEHDVYRVDDAFVFRFPRYAGVAENLDYDRAVHDLVRSSIGDVMTVPEISFFGRSSAIFPHRFVGHRLVAGIGVDDPRAPTTIALGSDLGRALTAVHAIPARAAIDIGMSVANDDCASSLDALMRQVPLVAGLRELAPTPFDWLHGPPSVPAAYAGPPRFIHNDLHGEHIIIDPESGRLSGIVDWSGAGLGDPAIDLAFLLTLGGAAFLDAALASYQLPVDAGFRERLGFRARVRALGWLTDALRRGVDTTRSLAEVRNAFST